MLKIKMPSLGVDIGNGTIKLAILGPGKKPKVKLLSRLPVPAGAIANGTILAPEPLGVAIKNELGIWKEELFTAITVSGPAVALRSFKLPLLKKAELQAAVEFESSIVLPIPLASAYWDYEVYPQQEHLEVLVAAAEKRVVENKLAVLAAAGLAAQAVELNPISLARSLRSQLTGTVAVLDLGLNFRELTIYHNKRPVFFRLLPGTGKEDFTQQADQLMSALLELVQELGRTLDFFSRERGLGVEKLLLVGYGASLPQLPSSLEEQLGREVTVGEPFRELNVAANLEKSPEFAIAVGLALRGIRHED